MNSGAAQVLVWMPLVMLVIGTSSSGTPAHTSFHRPLETSPCSLLTPLAWRLVRRARIVMEKSLVLLTVVWPSEKKYSKSTPTCAG